MFVRLVLSINAIQIQKVSPLRLRAAEHFITIQYLFVRLQTRTFGLEELHTTDEQQIVEMTAPLSAEGGRTGDRGDLLAWPGVTTRGDIAPHEAAIDQLGGPDLRHHREEGAAAGKIAQLMTDQSE